VNEPHIEPPREREQSLLPANSIGGDTSLSTNPILHGGQEVDNQTQDPNDKLQDTGTSPTASGDMIASEERPTVKAHYTHVLSTSQNHFSVTSSTLAT
jgi:hypothetical protein